MSRSSSSSATLGSPPATAAPEGWAGLPSDLLVEVSRRVLCVADRLRMAVVCRNWRAALAAPAVPVPVPRQLPWLLLPSVVGDRPSFFCLLSGGRRHAPALPDDAPRARYFGSYEGGWLLLATGRRHGHALVNFRSGARIPVPDVISTDGEQRGVVIRAAALSSPPRSRGFLAAAILTGPPHVAFWPQRALAAWTSAPTPPEIPAHVEDVLYHRGAFHVLTCEENIMMYFCTQTRLDPAGMMQAVHRVFQPRQRGTYDVAPDGTVLPEPVVARYLVENCGNLMMVVRLAPRYMGETRWFRLFHMRQQHPHCAWVELFSLDNRMLFVGRGCSRSFEASSAAYPGMGLRGGVYFLDDRSFYDVDLALQFPCGDLGKWLRSPSDIVRCFPVQAPSHFSPAIWAHP